MYIILIYLYITLTFLYIMKSIYAKYSRTCIEQFTMSKKKLAICIVGSIRSFTRKPYRDGLRLLLESFPNAHIFIVFKLEDKLNTLTLVNSEYGVNEFMETINVMRENLKHVFFFEKFIDKKTNNSTFISQLLSVNKCFNIAQQTDEYDYYMRMRPDYVILDMKLPESFDESIVYTAFQKGAPACDMVYLFSKKQKKTWWDKYVLKLIDEPRWYNHLTPEHILFEKTKVLNGPQFYGGLLRNDRNYLEKYNGDTNILFDDVKSLQVSETNIIENKYLELILTRMRFLKLSFNYQQYL